MRSLIMLAMLPLSACTVATSHATADSDRAAPSACRRDALTQFIGQPASQQLGARMLEASGARIIRWVPEGGVVTMDFNPQRITVQLDGANRVEGANCG